MLVFSNIDFYDSHSNAIQLHGNPHTDTHTHTIMEYIVVGCTYLQLKTLIHALLPTHISYNRCMCGNFSLRSVSKLSLSINHSRCGMSTNCANGNSRNWFEMRKSHTSEFRPPNMPADNVLILLCRTSSFSNWCRPLKVPSGMCDMLQCFSELSRKMGETKKKEKEKQITRMLSWRKRKYVLL